MKTKIRKFDAAEWLDSDEAIAHYLEDAIASGNAEEINQAFGTVARAKGMTEIARAANLGRESLYKALSAEGNPSFDTIRRVVNAMGLKLAISPQKAG